MKQTPLSERHRALGAKMVEFAGYEMPMVYSGITEEHMAVRNSVGVFDVSHMGEFIIRGREALQLVQKISSNDASRLTIGQAQYSCMPNLNGGIVDDLIVYRLPEDKCAEGEQAYMLVVNAANLQKDLQWIQDNNSFETRIIDISDKCGLLAVQGPKAEQVLQKLTSHNLADIKFYHFVRGEFAGQNKVLISATGYTGAGGFELYASDHQLPMLWDAIFEAGKEENIAPAGLGARDTLRLEMGYCLYGNDIGDETSPLEAGLGWITKLKKGPFNGSDLFIKQKEDGLNRKLVGFVANGRRVPRHGYEIKNEAGDYIGHVTSGGLSPCLEVPIGMGYVEKIYCAEGTAIRIDTGRKTFDATVKKPPFIKK